MRGLILAAGLGTRMGEVSAHRAKPALPMVGRPMIAYAAEAFARAGVREVAVNLHHRGEDVRAALGDGGAFGLRVRYSEERPILGTGGALARLRDFLGETGEDFLVANGDTVWDAPLADLLAAHKRSGRVATLVTVHEPGLPGYGAIATEADRVARLLGAGDAALGPGEPGTFTGIQALSPRIFDFMPDKDVFSSTEDLYAPLLRAGERLGAYRHEGFWSDVGTPRRYLETLGRLLALPPPLGEGMRPDAVRLGEGATVSPATTLAPPVWIGPGCRVSLAGVLGPNVVLGAGARLAGEGALSHATLWPGARATLSGGRSWTILMGEAEVDA